MMIITALAPYYKTDRDVKTAVDDALTYAKAKQNADGSFLELAETNAQVIVALSTLGIDCDSAESNYVSTIYAPSCPWWIRAQ